MAPKMGMTMKPNADLMQIYVNRNNQQLGPFTEAEIKAQLASGAISLQDHAWWQGQATWVPLSQTPYGGVLPTPPVPGVLTPIPGSHPTGERTSNYALWSLICGVCSFLCGLLFIPAIVLGHMGLAETKKDPSLKGRGMALAGMIIGYVMAALCVISLIAILVLMALGSQVQGAFKMADSQLKSAQVQESKDTDNTVTATPADQSTNTAPASDSSTNSTPTVTP